MRWCGLPAPGTSAACAPRRAGACSGPCAAPASATRKRPPAGARSAGPPCKQSRTPGPEHLLGGRERLPSLARRGAHLRSTWPDPDPARVAHPQRWRAGQRVGGEPGQTQAGTAAGRSPIAAQTRRDQSQLCQGGTSLINVPICKCPVAPDGMKVSGNDLPKRFPVGRMPPVVPAATRSGSDELHSHQVFGFHVKEARDDRSRLLPIALFGGEELASNQGQCVEACPAVVFRRAPFRSDGPFLVET